MRTLISIKDYLQKENVQAILICVLLLFLAIGVQNKSFNYMQSSAVKVLQPLDSADSIQKQFIEESLKGTSMRISTLKKQYLISEEIKKYYRGLGTSYYTNYYSFSICAIMFTTLLTIAVFLMVNKGWQNSGILLKAFLLATIVLSSVYYFLPSVLSNKENLNNNMEKIKIFQQIQCEIMSVSYQIDQMNDKGIDSSILSHFDKISANIEFPTTIDNTTLNNELSELLKNYKGK